MSLEAPLEFPLGGVDDTVPTVPTVVKGDPRYNDHVKKALDRLAYQFRGEDL